MSNTPECDPQDHSEKLHASTFKFPERKWSLGMRCDNLCSHTIALFGNEVFYPIHKTCKKWKMTLSSSMAMYSVMHDIFKKGMGEWGKLIHQVRWAIIPLNFNQKAEEKIIISSIVWSYSKDLLHHAALKIHLV